MQDCLLLLESAYEACLAYELRNSGLNIAAQVPLPVVYREAKRDGGYHLDLLVEDFVVVEVKSVEGLGTTHHAQVLSYLKLSGKKLGILINFNVLRLTHGIQRVVNGL